MRSARLLADLVRGVASLGALVALLVAPPILLVRFVGWPLPTSVSLDDIGRALSGASISDVFLIKALAVACWIAWMQVVLCAVVECAAWARGYAARAVPLGGVVQPLVRQLVITAALLIGSIRPTAMVPTATDQSPPIQLAPVLAVSTSHTIEAHVVTTTDARPSCVVRRRDSLWLLAERHLNDGMRWREIYELNRGQPQPGGQSLRDPDLIVPGWILQLPADAVGLDGPGSGPATPAAAVPSSPPPTLPSDSPTTSGKTPAPALPTTPTTPSSMTTLAPGADSPSSDDDPADDHFPVPADLAGATLLAAGVVLTIDRLRRRQMRHRQRGRLVRLPDAGAQHNERLLRAAAGIRPASRLDLALRLLAHQLTQTERAESTRVDVVRVDGDRIEILLTSAVEAPPGPFERTGERVWTLPTDTDDPLLEQIGSRQSAPAPALATVGHLDGCPVLIDLEGTPLVITGDRQRSTDLIWSMAVELATNVWADDVRVLVVGAPPRGLDALERMEVVTSLESVIEELTSHRKRAQDAVIASGHASSWSARIANDGDAWSPTIVFVAPDADDGVATPPGLGVVRWQEAPADAERTLALGPDHDRLEPLGLDLGHAGMAEPLLAATGDIIAVALSEEPGPELVPLSGLAGEASSPQTMSCYPIDLRTPSGTSEPGTADQDRVLVRILGPVRIDGAKNPIQRRRIRELIVYLALHPEGVTDEQIMTALWPGDTPSRSAFNQTVSRARANLGSASDGQPIVPYVANGLYRPSVHLVSDLQLLERALAEGIPAIDVHISGQPFAGSSGFEWAYVEGQAHRAAVRIEEYQLAFLSPTGSRNPSPTSGSGS